MLTKFTKVHYKVTSTLKWTLIGFITKDDFMCGNSDMSGTDTQN